MTSERLTEIERTHRESRGPSGCCPPHCDFCELLTVLREAQQVRDDYFAWTQKMNTDLVTERDALQRRVQTLEAAAQFVTDMCEEGFRQFHMSGPNPKKMGKVWAEGYAKLKAALRGEEAI